MIDYILVLTVFLTAFPVGIVLTLRMIDEWMTAEHWHLAIRLLCLLALVIVLVTTYFHIVAELFGAALAA